MYPRLFTIGPFTVYSYGLMLGIGFITASMLLTKELKRKGLDPNLGSSMTLLALFFGIAGSKMLYLVENWEYFVRAPFDMAFSPGGLTWYGGLILATLAIMTFARQKKISFLKLCDATAPGLMLAYGIGRIGCHLAGDGDYGVPTNAPWACVYSKGTYPPSIAFKDFPEIVQKYGVNGIVPDTIPVHPAPLYEFGLAVILFGLLWSVRKKITVDGKLFTIYLILTGIARFFVEFIRVNPRVLFGLSEAQVISILLIMVGIIWTGLLSKRANQMELSGS